MGAGQRLQASAKAGLELGQAAGLAQALAGDGLDVGQGVLDAVVQLSDQQGADLLGLLSFGDVLDLQRQRLAVQPSDRTDP